MRLKKYYRDIHLYASLFFIPMAVFYLITGSVCVLGIWGNETRESISLDMKQKEYFSDFRDSSHTKSSPESLQNARNKILAFLLENNLAIPYTTNIKDSWDNKRFVFGGMAYFLEIDKNTPESITYTKRDVQNNLVSFHFERGSGVIDVFAFVFMGFLFLTYVSGILLSSFSKHKWKYGATIGIGFVIMLGCMIISAV